MVDPRTLPVVQNGTGDALKSPERVRRPSQRSETGPGTLPEVWAGSGNLGVMRYGSGPSWRSGTG